MSGGDRKLKRDMLRAKAKRLELAAEYRADLRRWLLPLVDELAGAIRDEDEGRVKAASRGLDKLTVGLLTKDEMIARATGGRPS